MAVPTPPPTATSCPAPAAPARFPVQPLLHLDALWIQVAGTLCNLACTHCFISCGPGDERHALMGRAEVRARVAEALALGVKEFYFTGGEPFLHPEMEEILEDTLAHGPCTVLTNGTLFTRHRIAELRCVGDGARYSLELRVSLDGLGAAEHDRFRGAGSFARTIEGLRALEEGGLLPIVTLTRTTDEDPLASTKRALEALRALGLTRPRVKTLPLFQLGRESRRTRGYAATETLAGLSCGCFDPTRLQCGSCRAVTARGVYVCPLLVEEPGGRMGDRLAEALGPFELEHGACYTCWVTGMTCANG
ncbi:MAG: radical SAM protein [Candidatus Eisenbacteria bacterium]|nr:radical SAM protein [Candidatus Eisenbacteria bacterium]